MDRITVIVNDITGCVYDIEVPVDISAKELIAGLHKGLDHPGSCPKAMRSENPVAFLTGERLLHEYGLRDGSVLHFYEEDEDSSGGFSDNLPKVLPYGR